MPAAFWARCHGWLATNAVCECVVSVISSFSIVQLRAHFHFSKVKPRKIQTAHIHTHSRARIQWIEIPIEEHVRNSSPRFHCDYGQSMSEWNQIYLICRFSFGTSNKFALHIKWHTVLYIALRFFIKYTDTHVCICITYTISVSLPLPVISLSLYRHSILTHAIFPHACYNIYSKWVYVIDKCKRAPTTDTHKHQITVRSWEYLRFQAMLVCEQTKRSNSYALTDTWPQPFKQRFNCL